MQARIKSRGVREEEYEETDLNGQQDACVCGYLTSCLRKSDTSHAPSIFRRKRLHLDLDKKC